MFSKKLLLLPTLFPYPDKILHRPRRPCMRRGTRLEPPPLHSHSRLPDQFPHLPLPPRPQAAHQSIEHDHERHHRNHISPEQLPPLSPEPIPTTQPQQRGQRQTCEQIPHVSPLQFEYRKAVARLQGILQDTDSERIIEVVKRKAEEAEDRLVFLLAHCIAIRRRAS